MSKHEKYKEAAKKTCEFYEKAIKEPEYFLESNWGGFSFCNFCRIVSKKCYNDSCGDCPLRNLGCNVLGCDTKTYIDLKTIKGCLNVQYDVYSTQDLINALKIRYKELQDFFKKEGLIDEC